MRVMAAVAASDSVGREMSQVDQAANHSPIEASASTSTPVSLAGLARFTLPFT